jgi:predicted nucleic acid-binding protein
MPVLIDTSVAIPLRDRDPAALEAFARFAEMPCISIVTQVELEGGVYARPALTASRRKGVDALLAVIAVLPFDASAARAYRNIVARIGFSRRKVIDRMIAATAVAHGLTLATMNGGDFRDVPELKLEAWPISDC